MWEQAWQIAGVLVGLVGAFIAYRQYQLAQAQRASGARPRSASHATTGTSAAEKAPAHFKATKKDSERRFVGIALLTLTIVVYAAIMFERTPGWWESLLCLISMLIGGMMFDPFSVAIVLDEEGITISVVSWRTTKVRFSWTETESVTVKNVEGVPAVVLRLPQQRGLGSPSQQKLWNGSVNGFVLCDRPSISPADSNFFYAITEYSGGRCKINL